MQKYRCTLYKGDVLISCFDEPEWSALRRLVVAQRKKQAKQVQMMPHSEIVMSYIVSDSAVTLRAELVRGQAWRKDI